MESFDTLSVIADTLRVFLKAEAKAMGTREEDDFSYIFTRDIAFYGWLDIDEHDYHYYEDSPLIDAGDPDILDPDSTRSDIGPYPGGPYIPLAVRRNDDSVLPATMLVACYPNPFNSRLMLSVGTPYPKTVNLNLIDAMGRVVWRWSGLQLAAGSQTVTLSDFTGLSNGTYFLNIQSEDKAGFIVKTCYLK